LDVKFSFSLIFLVEKVSSIGHCLSFDYWAQEVFELTDTVEIA
jgi:hypothetical protein